MQNLALFQFSRRSRQSASALVLVVFVIAILGVIIGLAMDYTAHTAVATKRAQDFTSAQALANGALETTYKRWQIYMSSRQAQLPKQYISKSLFASGFTTACTTQVNAAAAATGFQVLNNIEVTAVDLADNPVDPSKGDTFPYTKAPLADVPGWIAKTYTFRARATVYKVADPSIKVSVSRYFQQADSSLFQAMLFFQDDLELHPGPQMTLYGLVHTNSNMYLAAGSNGSLTFTSNVSYHGNSDSFAYASNYKYLDPVGYVEGVTSSLFNYEKNNWNSFKAPSFATSRSGQVSSVKSLDPLGIQVDNVTDANNPNASGTHEIIERPAPVSTTNPNQNTAYTDPDAFSAHRIYNNAGLRVFINHNAAYSTTAYDATGKKVTVSSTVHVYAPDPNNPANSIEIVPTGSTKNPNIADSVKAAVATDGATGDITDMREGRAINASTLDMSVLTPALNAYDDYNGVVYMTDITNADSKGNTGDSDAIRIKKGGTLPDVGFTFATDGAVYVQGDFNTGTTYVGTTDAILSQPASNTAADPTKFTVSGYTQKPAAIMGDAVMILSNSWVDANSSLTINTSKNIRAATPTTLNAAIVSGAVNTTSSNPSGGAHNFPRFLENWDNKNFTYHGSMCELYASTHFDGVYGKANVYSPPNRRWFFDDSFIDTEPKGNLRATTFLRGRWARNTIIN